MMFYYVLSGLKKKERLANKILWVSLRLVCLSCLLAFFVVPCYSKVDMLLFTPVVGLFLLGACLKNLKWWANKYFKTRFLVFISTISYSLYVNHVVLFRKLRTLGQWDDHTPFSFQDLPRTYLVYSLDILSHYVINIPLAMLTYRFIETPFNTLGNKLAMKIPKNYRVSPIKAFLIFTSLIILAVAFIIDY